MGVAAISVKAAWKAARVLAEAQLKQFVEIVPELDDAMIDTIADGVEEQARGLTARDLERQRDKNLVGILHALKANSWGAGTLV